LYLEEEFIMKKKFISIIAVIIVAAVILKFYISLPSDSPKSDSNTAADTVTTTTDDTPSDTPDAPKTPVAAPAPTPVTVANLNVAKFDTGLTQGSAESDVVGVMHSMSHQKVRAEKKWGAVPMSADTIDQVYNVVLNSTYPHKDQLLSILTKWKGGDFSTTDADHNYLWSVQGGTEGKAFGVLSPVEEQSYVEAHFNIADNGVVMAF
jgi:hypothetical protein